MIEAARQGFVGSVTWADTWPGLLALAGLLASSAPSPCARCAARRSERRGQSRAALLGPSPSASPSGSCGRTGARASATGVRYALHPAQPWPLSLAVVLGLLLRGDRLAPLRPGARPGGAGEPAGGAAAGRLHRPHDLLGPARLTCRRLAFYNVASRGSFQTETIQPPLLAWAWKIAVGDPAAEPRIGAHMDWLAANRDLEGDGLLWIVQPDESGLDASPKFEPVWGWRSQRPDRLPAAGPAQPPARLRRAADPRARRPAALRDPGQHALVALAAGAGPALGDAGPGRAALGRAPRPLRRRGPAGRRPARRRHLGRPRAAGAARPAGGDRPPPGRGAPAERARVPHPGGAALGRRLASRATSPTAAAARSAATGAARPGSTRPGWSGSACAGSATRTRPQRLADGLIGAVAREGLREYYDPRTGTGLGAKDFAWSALIAELADAGRRPRNDEPICSGR